MPQHGYENGYELMGWGFTTEERFWHHVDRGEPDECWLWNGGRIKNGHGRFGECTIPGQVKLVLPHRYIWELTFGPIPAGLYVLHACDTPLCVNPEHLMVGTARANMVDAARKGRMYRGGTRKAA